MMVMVIIWCCIGIDQIKFEKGGDGMNKRGLVILSSAILVILTATVIWRQFKPRSISGKPAELVIAEQFGLAYAPLQIMKEFRLVEKYCPESTVRWRQLGNTAAIREAMVAGEIDAGFMAIPPFLIGYDKGMDWRIFGGLSESPVALVTNRQEIRSIKDFIANHRIALPQPGSVQHILLAMACDKEFGDAKRLDNLLVTLAHPDGMNALLANKEITAHFTAPPYLYQELKAGCHPVLDGEAVMGGAFTFIVGVASGEFYRQKPQAFQGLHKALAEAIEFVNHEPGQAAHYLAKLYKIPEAEVLDYLTRPGVNYTITVKGVTKFAQFMEKTGYINQTPYLVQLFWEQVQHD